jgi:hypothetical protein
MLSKTRYFLFSVVTLFVFILSLATPFTTYADEGTPPPPDAGSSESAPSDSAPSNAAPSDSAPSDTAPVASAPTDADQTAAAPSEAAQATEEPTLVPAESATPMAELPANTDVVALDANGVALPLATQQAAEIINTSDPVWCPTGNAPGSANCTPNRASMTDLLADLATKSGSGTIYFQSGNYAGPETSLNLDHSTAALTNLTDLGLEGGWDLTNNIKDTAITITTLSVPLSLTNWINSLTLKDIVINASDPTASLTVSTTGNIELTNVTAGNNTSASGVGAYLNTCVSASGTCTGNGDVSVTDSQFSNNAGSSGLYINPGGNINLTNVQANQNGYYGADIVDHTATGNVQITNSTFNQNDDTGLSVITNGTIALNSVQANTNNDGAYLNALKDINITSSNFDQNQFTGLYILTPGNVLLDNVSASQNLNTGAYIDTRSGTGSITVQNGSIFSLNNKLGLKALTGKGAISLTGVTIDGNNIAPQGAWMKTFDGGTVYIGNSIFQNNLGNGFEVISSGNVNLVNTTANKNGADGAQVYSTHSYACFGPRGIVVTVNSGTFQNNAGYGLFVSPGPEGSLVWQNLPVFGGNSKGDFFLDMEDHCKDEPCDDPDPKPTPTVTPTPSVTPDPKPTHEKEPINEVVVPITGGDPVPQDCEQYSGTLLKFETGTSVQVDCPFDGESNMSAVDKDKLPQQLPFGPDFVSALSVDLTKDGEPLEDPSIDGEVTISFKIPEDLQGGHFSIMYWDPTANDGAGDWVELPLAQFGGAEFPLYPDNPDDTRTILSGVQVVGDTVTVTVNFPGIFALVSR